MRLLAVPAVSALAIGTAVSLSPSAWLATPTAMAAASDCIYIQSSIPAYGGCMEWAEGCANCCRHEDQPMDVPRCAGGNQYKYCTDYTMYFKAKVHYCAGTPPNECQYAGEVQCGHSAIAQNATGICQSVP
jgi:hypothetical protein